jgi:hypothetical protein
LAPHSAWQTPSLQSFPGAQRVSQPPQKRGSVRGSTQLPAQSNGLLPPHRSVHWPATQTSLVPQVWLHVPQYFALLCRSTHSSPQACGVSAPQLDAH